MAPIVTVTLNPAVDRSCEVERVVPEHKLQCEALRNDPGGGGINVARAIGLLGGEALALWASGGSGGALLARLLDERDVPHQPIEVTGETRQNIIVFERTSRLQYRFGMPGPQLPPQDADRCVGAVRGLDPPPGHVVLSGSLPPGSPEDLWARIVEVIPSETKIIVDTRGPALRRVLGSRVHLIKPNLRELGQLAQRELQSDAEVEQAARELVEQGCVEVVVTSLGAAGALVVTADGCTQVRSPTVPIRSKVGAGDSTVAGITLALSRGASVPDAVRFGVAAGAAAVMTPGTELCRREDAERLYAQIH